MTMGIMASVMKKSVEMTDKEIINLKKQMSAMQEESTNTALLLIAVKNEFSNTLNDLQN